MLLSDLRIFPISYECIGHNALDENKITADTSKAKDYKATADQLLVES